MREPALTQTEHFIRHNEKVANLHYMEGLAFVKCKCKLLIYGFFFTEQLAHETIIIKGLYTIGMPPKRQKFCSSLSDFVNKIVNLSYHILKRVDCSVVSRLLCSGHAPGLMILQRC